MAVDWRPGQRRRPHADLGAARAHERVDAVDGLPARRVDGDRRAPCVVAVEAEPGARVDLRAPPGAEREPELGAHDGVRLDARVGLDVALDIEPEHVGSEPGRRPQPVRPPRLVAGVGAGRALGHPVVADRPHAHAVLRVEQADPEDLVVPEVDADRVHAAPPETRREPPVRDAAAAVEPAVLLFELVAEVGVVEEVGEVREQVEVVDRRIRLDARPRCAWRRRLVRAGERVAARRTAVRRVESAEPRHHALLNGAPRDLVRRVPRGGVAERRDRVAVRLRPGRVLHHPAHEPAVLGLHPRPVVVPPAEGVEHVAAADGQRVRDEPPVVVVGPDLGLDDAHVEPPREADLGAAGRREVAGLDVLRPLLERDPVDDLGDEQVEVEVALPVRVCREVHRDALEGRREVRSMVEVEPA